VVWISGELAERWADAVSTDTAAQKRGLGFWTRNRHLLPGPICFTLTSEQLLRGDWQRIVKASSGRCKCKQRRWMTPLYSPPYYGANAQDDSYLLGPDLPSVAIAPWGGDTQAVIMEFSIHDGELVQKIMPYMNFTAAELKDWGVGVIDYKKYAGSIKGTHTSTQVATLPIMEIAAALEDDLASAYPVTTLVPKGNTGLPFEFTPLIIKDVDVTSQTLIVRINRACVRIIPADESTFHKCA
jgi:hypothetical protein